MYSVFATKGNFTMKKNIHPKYTEATITCACGNVIKTRSTVKEMNVNTCAACHPYFTGQQTLVDTEGRIDQFRKRYGNFLKK
jgi:large subunit ribosomal protein L31